MNEDKKPNTPTQDANSEITLQNVIRQILPQEKEEKKEEIEKVQPDLKPNLQQAVQAAMPSSLSSTAPSVPTDTLNPNFLQKSIRTYQRDLAEALAKDAKAKGVNIPSPKAPVTKPVEKPIEKKIESPGDSKISFVKPIEAFRPVAPNSQMQSIVPPPVVTPPKIQEKSPEKPFERKSEEPRGNIYVATPIKFTPDAEKQRMPPVSVPPIAPPPPVPPPIPPVVKVPLPPPPPPPLPKPPVVPPPVIPVMATIKSTPDADKSQTIRTYEIDLAENVTHNKTSAATIAIAENKRREEQKKMEVIKKPGLVAGSLIQRTDDIYKKPRGYYIKRVALSLVSIVLVGGGITGGYYLYLRSPFAAPTPMTLPVMVRNVIPSDKKVGFNISTTANARLISEIYSQFNKNQLPTGKILELTLQENINNILIPISGPSFLTRIDINIPNLLTRSLTDKWMLGAYSEENGIQTPIIALTTDFFQNSFAGMLSWERTMPDDLVNLLNYREKTSSFGVQGQFIDRQIRNRDVREFTNTRGELLFLYSFIDKETIIITTTESAFIASLDRIEKQTYVR